MVRSFQLTAVALLALLVLSASPHAGRTATAAPPPGTPSGEGSARAAADLPDGDGRVTPAAVTGPRTKSPGMWTSRRPAEGGAYRWRIMAVGVAVLALTGLLLLRFVRRQQPATRLAR